MNSRRSILKHAIAFAGLALASSFAFAQDVAKVPDGHISIHYYRADGAYDGWGVHLWESFEKVEGGKVTGPRAKSDAPLDGITWMAPMKPTGKDGYGVYWQVKADNFRNGKYNYIIHKGDTKDQCGKDMHWFPDKGNQVFVNAGDCNMYFSAEDAVKARK